MKTKRLYQKQTLPAAVGREVLAVRTAELSNQEIVNRPCHVYVGAFQDFGKAYFINGGQDG
jgi:hypothetical protein